MNNDMENLLEELTKVRLENLSQEATKLFNTIMRILDERDSLRIERDYYKARYLEFNNAFIERKLDRNNTCLHCGEGKPAYCERLLSKVNIRKFEITKEVIYCLIMKIKDILLKTE